MTTEEMGSTHPSKRSSASDKLIVCRDTAKKMALRKSDHVKDVKRTGEMPTFRALLVIPL